MIIAPRVLRCDLSKDIPAFVLFIPIILRFLWQRFVSFSLSACAAAGISYATVQYNVSYQTDSAWAYTTIQAWKHVGVFTFYVRYYFSNAFVFLDNPRTHPFFNNFYKCYKLRYDTINFIVPFREICLGHCSCAINALTATMTKTNNKRTIHLSHINPTALHTSHKINVAVLRKTKHSEN